MVDRLQQHARQPGDRQPGTTGSPPAASSWRARRWAQTRRPSASASLASRSVSSRFSASAGSVGGVDDAGASHHGPAQFTRPGLRVTGSAATASRARTAASGVRPSSTTAACNATPTARAVHRDDGRPSLCRTDRHRAAVASTSTPGQGGGRWRGFLLGRNYWVGPHLARPGPPPSCGHPSPHPCGHLSGSATWPHPCGYRRRLGAGRPGGGGVLGPVYRLVRFSRPATALDLDRADGDELLQRAVDGVTSTSSLAVRRAPPGSASGHPTSHRTSAGRRTAGPRRPRCRRPSPTPGRSRTRCSSTRPTGFPAALMTRPPD